MSRFTQRESPPVASTVPFNPHVGYNSRFPMEWQTWSSEPKDIQPFVPSLALMNWTPTQQSISTTSSDSFAHYVDCDGRSVGVNDVGMRQGNNSSLLQDMRGETTKYEQLYPQTRQEEQEQEYQWQDAVKQRPIQRPAIQPDRDQMLWLQYFRQFGHNASPEEFESYKRFFLQQFQPVDELLEQRQFTITDVHDHLESREDAQKWIYGMFDMATHYKDKYSWQYERFGDPSAQFIISKAYR